MFTLLGMKLLFILYKKHEINKDLNMFTSEMYAVNRSYFVTANVMCTGILYTHWNSWIIYKLWLTYAFINDRRKLCEFGVKKETKRNKFISTNVRFPCAIFKQFIHKPHDGTRELFVCHFVFPSLASVKIFTLLLPWNVHL